MRSQDADRGAGVVRLAAQHGFVGHVVALPGRRAVPPGAPTRTSRPGAVLVDEQHLVAALDLPEGDHADLARMVDIVTADLAGITEVSRAGTGALAGRCGVVGQLFRASGPPGEPLSVARFSAPASLPGWPLAW